MRGNDGAGGRGMGTRIPSLHHRTRLLGDRRNKWRLAFVLRQHSFVLGAGTGIGGGVFS
jgi:hypothetical protein